MSESNCLSNNISEPSGKIMEVVTSCYIPQRMHFKVLPKNGIGCGKNRIPYKESSSYKLSIPFSPPSKRK